MFAPSSPWIASTTSRMMGYVSSSSLCFGVNSTTMSLTPITLATQGSKGVWRFWTTTRYYHSTASSSSEAGLRRLRTIKQLQEQNIARLYARRILELALASAAVQRCVTQMELQVDSIGGGGSTSERPQDWDNWQRRDFSQQLRDHMGDSFLQRWWAATRRIVSLTCLAAPLTVLYPLSFISDTMNDQMWKYSLWGIEQAGPSYIKLFQWATTRQDLFSPEFCQYFGQLQDRTRGHSWRETRAILKSELNIDDDNDDDQVLQLDQEIIGSGCIAQVYRGTLRKAVGQYPQGTEVAVKIQHPGIYHKVCVDFYIMLQVAKFFESLPLLNLQFLSLVDSVRQFRDIMLPQLNLELEAKHLQRFNRDFQNEDRVSFPYPIHDLTTSKVLTETFIHGTPILKYVNASEEDRYELASLGLNTTLKMIFLNDFLHGDLHPGNILVSREKTSRQRKGPLRLHLLDCGLVIEMGPDQHVNLVKILGAFTRRNGRLAGQLMVDTSSDSQASDLDVELFVKGIERIVVNDEDNNFLEKVGDYIADICFLACQRKVKLEACFINAALAVEIMEGIASALYPSLQVTTVALPLVMQAELMHRLPKFSLW